MEYEEYDDYYSYYYYYECEWKLNDIDALLTPIYLVLIATVFYELFMLFKERNLNDDDDSAAAELERPLMIINP